MKITDIQGTTNLANGVKMPYLGIGCFLVKEGNEVVQTVKYALEAGYRHIDTAAAYENEEGVGRGIRESSVPREEIFLTSKVWNTDQGYDSTLKAFDETLLRLQTDYLDLYLIHWPVKEKYRSTWKALERLYRDKRVRAIGVSNFLNHQLEDLIHGVEIMPMVNQMEFHPYLVQQDLLNACLRYKIQYEAWSPLMKGKVAEVPLIRELSNKYEKTPFQLVLRWDLQKGVVTIPKSVRPEHIISNVGIFDFEIAEEDMRRIDSLDKSYRFGPDPDNFDFND
jgi:diketogulonate reductase-like aldo/keto reductase